MNYIYIIKLWFCRRLHKLGLLSHARLRYLDKFSIIVPLKSGEIFKNIANSGNYQIHLFSNEIRSLVATNTIFVCVGANVGTTLINAKSVGFRRLVGFEPVIENFLLLKRNLDDNSIKCTIFNKGVSEDKREEFINLHPRSCGKHSLNHSFNGGQKQKISLISLDEAMHEIIQEEDRVVLWVDVEGHELEVLNGANKTMKENVIGGCIEVTPKFNNQEKVLKVIEFVHFHFECMADIDRGDVISYADLCGLVNESLVDQINLGFWKPRTGKSV